MSDDLVKRLREPLSQLPGDDDTLMERVVSDRDEAAQALTEARAEIERQADWIRRLQTALMFWMPGVDTRLDDATRELAADGASLLAGYSNTTDKPCWGDGMIDRATAAESELSTLRARVREVVGGMLAHSCVADAGQDCKNEEDEAAERAARQLMEDLK